MHQTSTMFGPRNHEGRTAAIRAIKAAAATLLGAGEDDAVAVNELRCSEPGCPPIETVIVLLRAGCKPRQVKVHKPVAEVTVEDLQAAIHAYNEHGHGDAQS